MARTPQTGAENTAQQNEQATGGAPPAAPPAPPPAPERSKTKAERRAFTALHNVVLGGVTVPPGSEIDLTREEHSALFDVGTVDARWGA